MPLLQVSRLLLAIRRSLAEYGNALLITCCVVVISLTARQITISPLSSPELIRINQAIYHPVDLPETDGGVLSRSKSQDGEVPEIMTYGHVSPMQGWFVLPEFMFENAQNFKGEMLKVPGDNKSTSLGWFEKLHQGLQLCEETLHFHQVEGSKARAPEAVIIRLLSARETIDCLVQRAASPTSPENLEPCPIFDQPDFELLRGYQNGLWKTQKPRRSMDALLGEICPPCAAQQDGSEKGKREILPEEELSTQPGPSYTRSRYFARQRNRMGKSRSINFWRSHDCEDEICREKDLAKSCSKDPARLSSAMKSTCQLCYPTRDENAIEKHCARRRRRERGVLYVLCAILITLIASAVFLVVLRDFRRRNKEPLPDREASPNRLHKDWSLPVVKLPTLGRKTFRRPRKLWCPGFLQSLSRRQAQLDVEGDPAWFDADAYIRKQDDQSPWHYPVEMQDLPRVINRNRGMPDTLKLRRVAARHTVKVEERVPVMPPARSSSVQISPELADEASQGRLRNSHSRSDVACQNRHFATVHARSPTERMTLAREMSRTLQ